MNTTACTFARSSSLFEQQAIVALYGPGSVAGLVARPGIPARIAYPAFRIFPISSK